MDQIREQVLQVLDKQQVLSRLKAELRANVFLAINDQDIRQGGIGLGSKSDATHRNHLAADPTGVLLLELVRELLQWCNLQFTQKVFEQEMQLGPAAALETLQKQLGSAVDIEMNQPLLLQLLQHVVGSPSPSWQSPTAQADVPRKQLLGAAVGQQAAAEANSRRSFSLPIQQLQGSAVTAAAAPEAAVVAAEAKTATAAQLSEADVCTVSAAASKLASKSTSLLGAASVAEDSSLIGTHLDEEEEEYATALLPKHRTSSSTGLEDEASSASSTYPVDTPRITARPVRAPAAAAAGQQAPASSLRPPGQHPPLPPLAARPPAEPPVSDYAAAGWDSHDGSGMAAVCELSESFGHDRSFGDSSLELQGLDSPPHGAAAAGGRAAAAAMDAEASYSSGASSSSSSSRGGSSRALSPTDLDVSGGGAQQVAAVHGRGAASLEPLPAARAPGKLAPLPPVGGMGAGGSSSGTGLTKRNSEGVRDELLRSGLLAPQPPAAAAPAEGRSAQQPLRAEASTDSYGADSEGDAAAAAAPAGGAGARMSDDSLASSNLTDSQDLGSWHGNPAAAAAAMGAVQPQQGRNSTTQRAGSLGQEYSQQQSGAGSGGDSDEDSDDDFGMRGQQQLLAAARRQLSNRSRSDAQGADHQGLGQQQQQGAGGMQVDVSDASLTLTCSADLDEDMIPEDISLPIDALIDGSDDSALFEPAQPAGGQAQAWGSSTRTAAGAGGTARAVGGRGAGQGAQQALELTDEGSESDRDQPLAVGAGFSIDDDDF